MSDDNIHARAQAGEPVAAASWTRGDLAARRPPADRGEAVTGELQALEQLALNFEAYASDQMACITKGWLRGRGIKDAEVRAEVWSEAAKDIREAIHARAARAALAQQPSEVVKDA